MNKYTIITAGGTGTRMKSDVPKQFLLLKGRPILMHSIERFFIYNNSIKIIISLPEEFISYWEELCKKYSFNIKYTIVKGGKTRFYSIQNALKEVANGGLVTVHDAVRPLVSIKTIENTFNVAEINGNAIASRDIFFSVRKVEELKNYAVNRNDYKEIQTPQTFKSELLKEAYSTDFEKKFTDDATVVEKLGVKINLVEGNPENIKITTKNDLIIAEALLNCIG
jgi:2-C-methyl-D-erythritol 4-phosphate cytidylyltransferase